MCHRHFVGITAFDLHRRDIKGKGTCIDPLKIHRAGPDGGREPALYEHDGVWMEDATPHPRLKRLAALNERRREEKRAREEP